MAKASAKHFRVTFVGHADEFRRAHRNEFSDISTETQWVDSLEEISDKPDLVVLNLDDKNALLAGDLVRQQFPQADLIGTSSHDSAQLAMQCLREGFFDFLTQPVSSEELALSLLRCRQRRESEARSRPAGDISRELTQISGATSLTALRIRTLSALQAIFGTTQTAWLEKTKRAIKGKTRVVIPCRRAANGKLLVSGITSPITRRKMDQAAAIVEHAELVLMNLRRVEKLKRQTLVDDLTGLYNSRYLRFALEAAVVHYQQKKEPFTLVFIDVDKFKRVNDRHGHLVGSEFLSALGRIIKNAVRTADLVFRYGGDEFVILLRNTGAVRGKEIAERLRAQIEKRGFVIRGTPLRSTVSIGLAVFPDHSTSTDGIIQRADEAMYMAKRIRNAVRLADVDTLPARRSRRQPEPAL